MVESLEQDVMSGEVEKCPILHVRPKFDVFTLLCDDLVLFKLWEGVIQIYLSFSIDTVPQWILWKRNREDWSLWDSRDDHSSSSSILPTLLLFRQLCSSRGAWTCLTYRIRIGSITGLWTTTLLEYLFWVYAVHLTRNQVHLHCWS